MLQSTQVLKLKNAVRSTLGSMALNDLQQVGVLDDVLLLLKKLEPQAGVKSTLTSLGVDPSDKQEQPAESIAASTAGNIKTLRKRSPKRSYSEKVRKEFARLLAEESKSVPSAARKLGINVATAYGWKSLISKTAN